MSPTHGYKHWNECPRNKNLTLFFCTSLAFLGLAWFANTTKTSMVLLSLVFSIKVSQLAEKLQLEDHLVNNTWGLWGEEEPTRIIKYSCVKTLQNMVVSNMIKPNNSLYNHEIKVGISWLYLFQGKCSYLLNFGKVDFKISIVLVINVALCTLKCYATLSSCAMALPAMPINLGLFTSIFAENARKEFKTNMSMIFVQCVFYTFFTWCSYHSR